MERECVCRYRRLSNVVFVYSCIDEVAVHNKNDSLNDFYDLLKAQCNVYWHVRARMKSTAMVSYVSLCVCQRFGETSKTKRERENKFIEPKVKREMDK